MTLPLAGVLVVALEQAVAAPACTCRLADAGARVIKIERPEGDFARSYDGLVRGQCSYFVWLNRGQESVVLDLARAEEAALLEAIVGRADVFVQNLKPGAVDKLGFSIERLRRDDPALIVCSISGYVETLSSKLAAADIAFARINDMAGLARHPQLRRITLNSPNGPISYPAPAPRRAGETRHSWAMRRARASGEVRANPDAHGAAPSTPRAANAVW
jgi:crotonobetainyl-CoA:carnitine CoA-transferase CaiB-like acyl-CoA transferase